MEKGTKLRKGAYALIIGLISSAVLLLPISGNVSADWFISGQTTLTGGPIGDSTIYHQESPVFQYTLSIPAIPNTNSVEIRHAKVQLDWESSATECLGSVAVVTPLPGSLTFQRTVLVPQAITDGDYGATITITGKASNDLFETTHSWDRSISVGTRPDLKLIISGNPSSGATPLDVQFTSTPSGGTEPYSYSWTFGDGQTSTSSNPSHAYATAGTFTATLVIHDALSRTAQATFSVTTYNPLQITASADKTNGNSPLTVQFSCSASGGSPAYSYSWTFGDGATSTEANPSHKYQTAGTYDVTLVVTDSQSRQKTYSTTITVIGAGIPGMPTDLLIIVGVIAIAVIIAVALVALRKKPGTGQPPK